MHNADRVSSRQRPGDLRTKIENFAELHRGTSHALAQRLAVDELHSDKVHTIVFAYFIDVRDVGMIEGGGGRRLLFEAAYSILISIEFAWQSFQRDFTVQTRVLCKIHLAHPAFANLGVDFVVA